MKKRLLIVPAFIVALTAAAAISATVGSRLRVPKPDPAHPAAAVGAWIQTVYGERTTDTLFLRQDGSTWQERHSTFGATGWRVVVDSGTAHAAQLCFDRTGIGSSACRPMVLVADTMKLWPETYVRVRLR